MPIEMQIAHFLVGYIFATSVFDIVTYAGETWRSFLTPWRTPWGWVEYAGKTALHLGLAGASGYVLGAWWMT